MNAQASKNNLQWNIKIQDNSKKKNIKKNAV